MAPVTRSLWRCMAASATGSRHIREGKPNQDSAGVHIVGADEGRTVGAVGGPAYLTPEPHRGPVVLAVADGHGSDRYTRSDRGSQFAVRAAREVLSDNATALAAALPGAEEEDREQIGREVARRIVDVWRRLVFEDVQDDPLATPVAADKTPRPTSVARAPSVPYGTTLLAALVSDEVCVYIQIGDGAMVTVHRPNEPTDEGAALDSGGRTSEETDGVRGARPRVERVFPKGDEIGEGTDSLCQPDPTQVANVRVTAAPPPALVLLATDGFDKAFEDEDGFLEAATDYLGLFESSDGLEVLESNVEGWLSETSAGGTGDDTSIVVAHLAAEETVEPEQANPAEPRWRIPFVSLSALFGR